MVSLKYKILVFLLLIFSSSYTAVIKEIEIIGNKKIESESIKYRLKSKVGEELSPDNIKKDIKSIFSQGFYSDISVKKYILPDGKVKLSYVIVEKPIIKNFVYRGASEVDLSDIEAENDVKIYSILSRVRLNKVVKKISALYEKKGFFLAEINYDVVLKENNEVEVVFNITEYQKVLIKKIIILGNKRFSDEKLKSIMMQTKEGETSSWISSKGTYSQEGLKIDLERIKYFYRNYGYIQVQASTPEIVLSPDKRFIYITFHITEGVPFNVGLVDLEGDFLEKEPQEKLKSLLKLKEGEVFNREYLSQDIFTIQQLYEDYGYAFANVVPKTMVDEEKRKIDVLLDIDKGKIVRIGKIIFKGNDRTRDKVIRRELAIQEGELYHGSNIKKSRENIYRLGFFSEVNLTTPYAKGKDNVLDIEISVKEKQTGSLQVGAGFSSYEKFMGQAQISENNFLGYGQTISLKGEFSKPRQEITTSFEEPYLFDTIWSGGVSFSYRVRKEKEYKEKNSSGSLTLGYPIGEYTKFFGTTSVSYVLLGGGTYKYETFTFPNRTDRFYVMDDSTIYSLRGSVSTDKRDNRFDPSKGYYVSGSYEYTLGAFSFHELFSQARYFYPLIWNIISRTRLEYRYLHPQGDKGIPVNRRYSLGGIFSVRGYAPGSIGPKTEVTKKVEDAWKNDYLYTYGGVHQIVFNQEFQFDIIKEAGLKGVFFFDAGNTFDEYDALSNKLLKKAGDNKGIYMSVGWGFRWLSPLGPLRFEFGHPLPLKKSLLSADGFEFMIGQFF